MEDYKIEVVYKKENYLLVANNRGIFEIYRNDRLIRSGCCDSFEEAKAYVDNYVKTQLKGSKKIKNN